MSPGFTIVDNDTVIDRLPEIGLAAIAVYLVLRRHCDGDGICWPSVDTIAREAGLTSRTVRRALRRLAAAGLLHIEAQKDHRGVAIVNRYRVLPRIPQKQADTNDRVGGHKRQCHPDTNDSATLTQTPVEQHPIEQHPIEQHPSSSRAKLRFDVADRETASWMFGLIKALDGNHKQPNLDQWANDIRLTREQDHRTDAEIRATFQWANQDGFWKSNILSPTTLRKKFTTLILKMKSGANGNGNSKHGFRTADSLKNGSTTESHKW